jgi:glycosyltransferase involved in cell wall biosynthesis
MRILFVNQYFPPDTSNTAYILGELAEDLAVDHEVQVLAGQPSYTAGATTFAPRGVDVVRVRSTRFDRKSLLGRLVNYVTFCVLSPLRGLSLPRPDVVVAMTDPPVVGLVGLLLAKRHSRPFVQISHDVYPEIAVALGKLRSPAVVATWRWLNRIVRTSASSVVVVGRDMEERLVADGVDPDKIVVVPTWASEQPLEVEVRTRTRNEMGWDGDFVVMHAGNVGLAQNLDVLLDAAAELRSDGDVRIVILGDGASKQALEERARSESLTNVVFLAHRPKDEAQRVMAAADVHVVSLVPGLWGCAAPSKTYGVMAAGRPFIAVVDEGSEPHRIAQEFDCGLHVSAGDAPGLAEAVRRMRTWSLDQAGERALTAFRLRYTRERSTTATRRHLEQVVDRLAA